MDVICSELTNNGQSVLDFWFDPDNRYGWFRATPAFDQRVRERFEAIWALASDRRLAHWEFTPQGALALVIVLDQLPLNMFRGRAESFSSEALSREVAAAAIERGFDQQLVAEQLPFMYLPFMHSESLADQDRSVQLFERAGLSDNLRWAGHHREIVRRFGRFPHRNAILGRESTPEEIAWLASDEAFGG